MPRAIRPLPSPSAIVPALLRWVTAHGRDAAELAARFGLAPEAADADEVPVAPSTVHELLAATAELFGEPFLALRLPAELPVRRYGLAELAARASTTIGDALDAMARYAQLIDPALVLARDGGRWSQRTPAHPRGIGRCAHEYGLAYVLTHVRAATPDPVVAVRAWFAHARPPLLAPLHRFFGTRELAFGEPDSGFELPDATLARPLASGDTRLLATVTALAEASVRETPRTAELAPRVTAHVRARLAQPVSADAVATALHMSPRTLQRRLEAEGTTFTELVDLVREVEARRLIAHPALALAEIGYRTGFADLATFSRAFKRWTGKPPGQFRRS